jgi:hypothetical protein
MPASEDAVPDRPADKVLRCSGCGFTTYEELAARDHVQYECGKPFDLVEKAP